MYENTVRDINFFGYPQIIISMHLYLNHCSLQDNSIKHLQPTVEQALVPCTQSSCAAK